MQLEMVGLFHGLTESTRRTVSALAEEQTHKAGQFLFHSGDPARHLYVLESGRVRLKIGESGHVAMIQCDAGCVVGWSSMAGHATYFASAECLDTVVVLRFDRDALTSELSKDPVSGLSFYRGLTEVIGSRLIASYGATVSVHGNRDPKYWG